MVAAKLVTLKNGENKTDRARTNVPAQSIDDVASVLNVSGGSVKRAKQVLGSKSKPLIEAVESGVCPLAAKLDNVCDNRKSTQQRGAG